MRHLFERRSDASRFSLPPVRGQTNHHQFKQEATRQAYSVLSAIDRAEQVKPGSTHRAADLVREAIAELAKKASPSATPVQWPPVVASKDEEE